MVEVFWQASDSSLSKELHDFNQGKSVKPEAGGMLPE